MSANSNFWEAIVEWLILLSSAIMPYYCMFSISCYRRQETLELGVFLMDTFDLDYDNHLEWIKIQLESHSINSNKDNLWYDRCNDGLVFETLQIKQITKF